MRAHANLDESFVIMLYSLGSGGGKLAAGQI